MNYDYYKDTYKGLLDEETFNSLLPKATDLLYLWINDQIPFYRWKPSIEDYNLDIDLALCYQIDFIDSNGGLNSLNGVNELDISAVVTDGFKFEKGHSNGNSTPKFDGIYVSAMATNLLKQQLVLKRLTYAGIR